MRTYPRFGARGNQLCASNTFRLGEFQSYINISLSLLRGEYKNSNNNSIEGFSRVRRESQFGNTR